MNNEEALMTIGMLAMEARAQTGETRVEAGRRLMINYQTIKSIEEAVHLAKASSLQCVERGYGWSLGSIMRLWDRRFEIEFGSVSLADLKLKPHEIEVPLARASELSTEELLAEIQFRVLMLSREHADDPL